MDYTEDRWVQIQNLIQNWYETRTIDLVFISKGISYYQIESPKWVHELLTYLISH